jgi:hypothetical protein
MQLSVVEITFNIRERPPKEAKIQGADGYFPLNGDFPIKHGDFP